MMQFKQKIAAVVAGTLLASLAGCGGGEEDAVAPETYTIGGETITALAAYEGVTVTQSSEEDSTEIVYVYEGIQAPGAAVESYAAQMTGEEGGFSFVDENDLREDAPDYNASEGDIYLARPAAEEGTLLSIELEWAAETCTVTTESREGTIQEAEGMTYFEALDYFNSLSPASLGLEGASMKQYGVYAPEGTVLVDERPCLRLNVYSTENPEGTNELVGMYLMTGDGRHVYRLEGEPRGVVELPVTR